MEVMQPDRSVCIWTMPSCMLSTRCIAVPAGMSPWWTSSGGPPPWSVIDAIIDELVAAFPQELLNLPPTPRHAIAPTPEGA